MAKYYQQLERELQAMADPLNLIGVRIVVQAKSTSKDHLTPDDVDGGYSRFGNIVDLVIPKVVNFSERDRRYVIATMAHELGHAFYAVRDKITGPSPPFNIRSPKLGGTEKEAWEYGLQLSRRWGVEREYSETFGGVYAGVHRRVLRELKNPKKTFQELESDIPLLSELKSLAATFGVSSLQDPPNLKEAYTQARDKMRQLRAQWKREREEWNKTHDRFGRPL